ncbi:MAG: glutamate formimidoyltransferase [Chthonomonadales bacterium]|nr:glutamate formimidoyltransferase [Chthonomonadales bacterium]
MSIAPAARGIAQCAANFSEGARPEVVEAIVSAASGWPGCVVADWSADPDHNRLVVTLLGHPRRLEAAVLAAAQEAVRRIDLRAHRGAHPRIGAVDVVPFVPLRGISMAECAQAAANLGRRLAAEMGLPVYLYEESAAPGRRRSLPDVRRGGFERLSAEPLSGERAPDFGPMRAHPTAGAVVVGARRPLVAFNVLLDAEDPRTARAIAHIIRAERETHSALGGVRALGLALSSRRATQVSMNLTEPDRSPMPDVYAFVRAHARALGADVVASEVIGLVPRCALGGRAPSVIRWRAYRPHRIVEYWLDGPGAAALAPTSALAADRPATCDDAARAR